MSAATAFYLGRYGHFTVFQTVSRAVLSAGIALVLFACVKPIDLEGFINRLPTPDFGLDIDYEVSDESPALQWSADGGESWETLNEGDTVTISLNTPSTVIIEVIDQGDYADITWYCDSPAALTAGQGVTGTDNERLTIIPGTASFTWVKTYQMAVVGTKGGQLYGTSVFIRVDN